MCSACFRNMALSICHPQGNPLTALARVSYPTAAFEFLSTGAGVRQKCERTVPSNARNVVSESRRGCPMLGLMTRNRVLHTPSRRTPPHAFKVLTVLTTLATAACGSTIEGDADAAAQPADASLDARVAADGSEWDGSSSSEYAGVVLDAAVCNETAACDAVGSTCEAGYLVRCIEDEDGCLVESRVACADMGATCATSDGGAACEGGTCPADDCSSVSPECDGTVLVECIVGDDGCRTERRTDCASATQTCTNRGASEPRCIEPETLAANCEAVR